MKLNISKCGCDINGTFTNHYMYADDSCVIAPSPSGLQNLLNICKDFTEEISSIYNDNKSKHMCVKAKTMTKLLYSCCSAVISQPLGVSKRAHTCMVEVLNRFC